jgi:hypothetical protein
VVDYGFGTFKFQALAWPAPEDGGLQREITAAPRNNQLAIASFNVENLDPADPRASSPAWPRRSSGTCARPTSSRSRRCRTTTAPRGRASRTPR